MKSTCKDLFLTIDGDKFIINGTKILTEYAFSEEFTKRLIALKDLKGYSYTQLGHKAQIHPNTISNWVHDGNVPRLRYIFQLAAALDCRPEYLLCLTDTIKV